MKKVSCPDGDIVIPSQNIPLLVKRGIVREDPINKTRKEFVANVSSKLKKSAVLKAHEKIEKEKETFRSMGQELSV